MSSNSKLEEDYIALAGELAAKVKITNSLLRELKDLCAEYNIENLNDIRYGLKYSSLVDKLSDDFNPEQINKIAQAFSSIEEVLEQNRKAIKLAWNASSLIC